MNPNNEKDTAFRVPEAARDNILGKKLAEARRDRKLRQSALVEMLEEYGIRMTAASYSCWETGARTPNAYQLLALARVLGIEDVLGYFLEDGPREGGIGRLNDEGRALAESYIRLLADSGEYDRVPASPAGEVPEPDNLIDLDLYLLAASAGTGQYLDSDLHETIRLPENLVPRGTEFAVRISGDSMEPAFYSDQIAFVKRAVTLQPGDIGIFVVDGESYIKKYEEEMPGPEELEDYLFSNGNVQRKPVLLSMNEKYPPIRIRRAQKVRVVGKVLNRTGFEMT